MTMAAQKSTPSILIPGCLIVYIMLSVCQVTPISEIASKVGLILIAMPARAYRSGHCITYLAEGGGRADADVCGAPDQCPDHGKVYAVHRLPGCPHKWSQHCLQKAEQGSF